FLFIRPTPTTIYTLSLHDALPISLPAAVPRHRRRRGSACLRAGRTPEQAGASGTASDAGLCSAILDSGMEDLGGGITPYEATARSEEHTSELQSRFDLVCRLLLEK